MHTTMQVSLRLGTSFVRKTLKRLREQRMGQPLWTGHAESWVNGHQPLVTMYRFSCSFIGERLHDLSHVYENARLASLLRCLRNALMLSTEDDVVLDDRDVAPSDDPLIRARFEKLTENIEPLLEAALSIESVANLFGKAEPETGEWATESEWLERARIIPEAWVWETAGLYPMKVVCLHMEATAIVESVLLTTPEPSWLADVADLIGGDPTTLELDPVLQNPEEAAERTRYIVALLHHPFLLPDELELILARPTVAPADTAYEILRMRLGTEITVKSLRKVVEGEEERRERWDPPEWAQA